MPRRRLRDYRVRLRRSPPDPPPQPKTWIPEFFEGLGIGIALYLMLQAQGILPTLPTRETPQETQPPELPNP